MVEDGSFDIFKEKYNTAKTNNLSSFLWEGRDIDMLLGQAIIEVGEQATKEYDEHLDKQALNDFNEWQIHINR